MDVSDDEERSLAGVKRAKPNVLITGTPGTGKTTTADLVVDMLGAELRKRVNVSDLVKAERFYEDVDDDGTVVIDEDQLLDHMEELLAGGGVLVEFHGCDLFPERWFDAVVVLRCENATLFDRLSARGYSEAKRNQNLQCEIMEVIETEARESYREDVVHVLQSDTAEQLQRNAKYISDLYRQKANDM